MEDATLIHSPMDPHIALENEHCEGKPADQTLYLNTTGSLMFAALGTRPDIPFSITAEYTQRSATSNASD